jgi:hypothetical protein
MLGLLVSLIAALIVGVAPGRAVTAGSPVIEKAEAASVYATRAILLATGRAGSEIHSHFEYSTGPSGPWISTTSVPSDGRFFIASAMLDHLSPMTTYYARVFIESESGVVLKAFEFATGAVSAPEITFLSPFKHTVAGSSIGADFANFEAEIQTNGAETEYQFEYAQSPEGPWSVVPGSSARVTIAEDFVQEADANLTGLTPETKYYVRVSANNEKGSVNEFMSSSKSKESYLQFKTAAAHPEASVAGASKVTGTSALLSGGVGPRSVETQWRFEYATSPTAVTWEHGPEGTISAAEASEENEEVGGELSDLSPDRTYYVRLFAKNAHGELTSSVESFETGGPPVVLTFAAHTFVAGSETIRALGSVEPHGSDTHYHFEYVDQESFATSEWTQASSTPVLDAGTGEYANGAFPDLVVGGDLLGLEPGKTYEYRLVASSAAGIDDGSRQSLPAPVTGPAEEPSCSNEALRGGPSGHLPDCRAYEQVTPVEKTGSMDSFTYGTAQTSVVLGEDGEHVMVNPEFSKWGSSPDATNSSYFFSRTPSGWLMTSATLQPQAGDESYRPSLFDSDLSQIGLNVGWAVGVGAADASPNLEFEVGPPGGPYRLVASVPRAKQSEWVAASKDLDKVILASEDHDLLAHATGTTSGEDLYEYSGGHLRQVNVDTGGGPISSCGATMAQGFEGDTTPEEDASSPHAVSADGSRVFFDDNCTHDLYMRIDGEKTVDIGAYEFLAADADGSELLLEKMGGEVREFFLYDTETASTKLLFTTHSEIKPIVSEDANEGLTALYFVSTESLNGEAPSPSVQSEHAGGIPKDLYRYDIPGESLHFIVQTSGDPQLSGQYVSPDGRYYYWGSEGVAGASGEPGDAQSYRYDSVENVVQCVSCASSFDPNPKTFAIFLTQGSRSGQTYDKVPDPTIASENGDYVFFDSLAPLVAQDVDGEALPTGSEPPYSGLSYSGSSDVYEWRKNGIDGCAHVQGCLALISSGTGGLKNVLLGTTPSGRDVFFATHSQLVSGDDDGQGDVYDARIGGGIAPPLPGPTECEGDACSSPLAGPIDTTPASLSFVGPGNPVTPVLATKTKSKKKAKAKACARGMVRAKDGRCVRRKQGKAGRAGRVLRTVRHDRGGHK